MQKSSNSYIMLFIITTVVIVGTTLSFVSESLKEKQAANIALENKKFILTTYLGDDAIEAMSDEEINDTYDKQVQSKVVNFKGEVVDMKATDVIVVHEYKKAPEDRMLPVYEIMKEGSEELQYLVIPVFGYGLWDNIWGFIALENDFNTIKGVVYDHKGETPGLGQRVATKEVQERYEGKELYNNSGNLVSIEMVKGERGGGAKSIKEFENDPHKVDGMSGSTITGKGLNNMLKDYFKSYENYFKTKKSN